MLKICSFNIKNDFINHVDKTNSLISFISKHKIDILAVQEYLFRDTKKFNFSRYNVYGKGRLKHQNSIFNETNCIITNLDVNNSITKRLPWMFTTFPRIMTSIKFKDKNNECILINTHLDYLHYFSQKKQLNFIYNYLKNIPSCYKVILLGDFNLTVNSRLFNNFINNLAKINISRVDINGKTYKFLNDAIDHVFVSNDIKIKRKKIIIDKDFDISDHYPIYIEII